MSQDKRSSKRWGNTTSKDGESSRIFIGNLPHSTNAGELEDKFKPYGDLEGVDINSNGFAFVQFRSPEEAKAAVSSENGSFMASRKIEVRMFDKTGPKKNRIDANSNRGYNRDRSPLNRRGNHETPEPFAPGFHPQQIPPQFGHHHHQAFNAPPVTIANMGGPPMNVNNNLPNDVEIIVIDREQWAYGEAVEKRLKDQAGIPRVDMLFLHSPQHISMTLNDLFDRGTLYAVVVAPENESHNTVTIHVLQNQTEYRNISLEKAIGVIASDFQGSRGHRVMDSRNGVSVAVSGQPSVTQNALPPVAPNAASMSSLQQPQVATSSNLSGKKGLPEEVAYLLRTTLAEQGVQFLSLQQIDSIIDFFTRERDRLTMRQSVIPPSSYGQQSSYGDFASGGPASNSVIPERQSVLQRSADLSSMKSVSSSGSVASPSVPNNLLDNPHVKQALSALGVNLGALGSVGSNNGSNHSSYDHQQHNNSNGSDRFGSLASYTSAAGNAARRDQVSGVSGNASRMPPVGPPLGRGPGLFGGTMSGRF